MANNDVCLKYIRVAFASTGHKEAVFTRLRCKQWTCPACARMNASLWRNWLLKRLPEVSDDWFLITLTANENTRTRDLSMDNLRIHLDAFFKRVKRVFGAIEYARVYEPHPTSDAVHVHIIIAGLAPYVAVGQSVKLRPMAIGVLNRSGRNGVWSLKTWVKINARELKMGYIADAKRLTGDVRFVALYITKYLTKDQGSLHVKGLRHVQVTSGIGSPTNKGNDLDWSTASYIVATMFDPNTAITDLNTGRVINNDYWEEKGFYPDE